MIREPWHFFFFLIMCRSSTLVFSVLYYPRRICFNVISPFSFSIHNSFSQVLCSPLPVFFSSVSFALLLSIALIYSLCFYFNVNILTIQRNKLSYSVRCTFLFIFGFGLIWRYTLTSVSFDYIILIKWIQAFWKEFFLLSHLLSILLPLVEYFWFTSFVFISILLVNSSISSDFLLIFFGVQYFICLRFLCCCDCCCRHLYQSPLLGFMLLLILHLM